MINHFSKLCSTEEEKNIVNELTEELKKSTDFDPLSHFLNLNRKNK